MHQMVIGFEKSLMKHRANIEERPLGFLEVKLRIEVKKDTKTWTHFFNKLSDALCFQRS